eukprot:PhF_6_TR40778/c0_g1_i2/m.61540
MIQQRCRQLYDIVQETLAEWDSLSQEMQKELLMTSDDNTPTTARPFPQSYNKLREAYLRVSGILLDISVESLTHIAIGTSITLVEDVLQRLQEDLTAKALMWEDWKRVDGATRSVYAFTIASPYTLHPTYVTSLTERMASLAVLT